MAPDTETETQTHGPTHLQNATRAEGQTHAKGTVAWAIISGGSHSDSYR